MTEIPTERDLRALISVVEDGRRDEPNEAMPWALLDGLAQLVGCDRVTFHDWDLPARFEPVLQEAAEGERALAVNTTGDDAELDFFLSHRRDFLPEI